MSKAESADKLREETAQALVSQCTELQTEVGLYDRVLLSGPNAKFLPPFPLVRFTPEAQFTLSAFSLSPFRFLRPETTLEE